MTSLRVAVADVSGMAHATTRENQMLAAQAKQAAAERDQKQQEVQQLKVGRGLLTSLDNTLISRIQTRALHGRNCLGCGFELLLH